MDNIRFLDDNGTFTLSNPENVSGLYFPLAGETGLKSAVTPGLGGDCKLDQESFLLEPVSAEDLHASRSTRNFWCITEAGCWSATGASAGQEAERFTEDQDESALTAGLMWQKVSRETKRFGLRAEITSFVPPRENVEVMEVKIINTDSVPRELTCVAAVPIYGRSADNVRDHRNVTSMLHRTRTAERGVLVKPAMSFDEKGHRENHKIYYVLGSAGNGTAPETFYPTVEGFLGEGGTFLPHHDYGRGGRGWRDLWQDCLSLLLMDPGGVGEQIRANFGGVRVDGTNATIIGDGVGNFIADRNGIARVWMDHALWPLMTTRLYIDQTGDLDILLEAAPYFKDPQVMRGTQIDPLWNEEYGNRQRTPAGTVYTGSILEHLLIQHLAAFYEVGAHNIFRLRGADWNDTLDMAAENGESVAFTCAYAGNLQDLAGLLRRLAGKQEKVELLAELRELLESDPEVYEDISRKKALLEGYTRRCIHQVSGQTVSVSLAALAENLEGKARWLMEHIRRQEWIKDGADGWFNSYYDNHCRPLEGVTEQGVRMMLTGQVFAIMSGTATEEQVGAITRSADRYLYKREAGGYRLNTDFHELKLDMGRMFGFAYGEKENGAVFSHMTVMYANALYRRGFVREGYRALQTLAETAMDFSASKIFPGIPEYFNAEGRGMYHYLTGAASWYMLTVITQVFGVHGEEGALVIEPKLVREQFDETGEAAIDFSFAGKGFRVVIVNRLGKDFGEYSAVRRVLSREVVDTLPKDGNTITIELM